MSYKHYRATTLGIMLRETLNELIMCGHINPDLADTVLIKYDESINEALSKRVTAKVNFRADKLMNYRHCDNVWTLILKDVEFREGPMVLKVDSVKVVACIGLTD